MDEKKNLTLDERKHLQVGDKVYWGIPYNTNRWPGTVLSMSEVTGVAMVKSTINEKPKDWLVYPNYPLSRDVNAVPTQAMAPLPQEFSHQPAREEIKCVRCGKTFTGFKSNGKHCEPCKTTMKENGGRTLRDLQWEFVLTIKKALRGGQHMEDAVTRLAGEAQFAPLCATVRRYRAWRYQYRQRLADWPPLPRGWINPAGELVDLEAKQLELSGPRPFLYETIQRLSDRLEEADKQHNAVGPHADDVSAGSPVGVVWSKTVRVSCSSPNFQNVPRGDTGALTVSAPEGEPLVIRSSAKLSPTEFSNLLNEAVELYNKIANLKCEKQAVERSLAEAEARYAMIKSLPAFEHVDI